MELRQISPLKEWSLQANREEPRSKPVDPPQGKPMEGTPPAPDRVGAASGAADVHEFARHMAEILNQAMKDLRFSVSFHPDAESGVVIVRVLDANGELIRVVPLEEFAAMNRRLAMGALENGLLTSQLVR